MNVVFLTDGAANTNRTVYDPDDEYGSKNMQLGWYHSQNSEPNTFVVDPKTKNSIGIVTDSSLTDSLLRHFGDRHSTNVIGMFISDANLRPVIELHINPENSKSYEEMTDINKSWRRDKLLDLSGNENHGELVLGKGRITKDDIQISKTITPHRRWGSMECMYHDDEGIVNQKFAGDPKQTSKNEIVYKKGMQKEKIDIDENGLSNMKYEIVSEEDIYNRHKLINVRF